jgi:hypothetical protein
MSINPVEAMRAPVAQAMEPTGSRVRRACRQVVRYANRSPHHTVTSRSAS